ncbi:MAG: PEP-CTERM sorting domain-containing protein [Tepidisphaeraceae bacterium]|jgi:hypothetical protein
MRRKSFWISAILLGAALSARTAQAQTIYLYTINVDENGNGSYVEYSPPVVGAPYQIASGTLPSAPIGGGGVSYLLPYPITINGNSNQWLGVTDPNSSQSDLINFANTGPGGLGVLNFYSNDTDGDLADVSPADWAALDVNWDGRFTTSENAEGIAFYSTYIDTGGVPGDPAPHPTVEAFYDLNSGNVPEPTVMGLLLGGSALLLNRRPRRA